MVDEMLAKSFERSGADYDRFRPGIPSAAAEMLLPAPVEAVLDLGAGTGTFTERLLGRAGRVIAVEPAAAMLDVLRSKLPEVVAVDGTAESIPLPDTSVDAVAVAQAFHWFDRERACAEISRVLLPGGMLGLVWNHSDPDCAWDRAAHKGRPSGGRRRRQHLRQCRRRSSRLHFRAPRGTALERAHHTCGLPRPMVDGEHVPRRR